MILIIMFLYLLSSRAISLNYNVFALIISWKKHLNCIFFYLPSAVPMGATPVSSSSSRVGVRWWSVSIVKALLVCGGCYWWRETRGAVITLLLVEENTWSSHCAAIVGGEHVVHSSCCYWVRIHVVRSSFCWV